MNKIEKQARKIVRDAYFDYLEIDYSNRELKDHFFRIYYHYMQFLEDLFPDTTDEDKLESKWRSMFKKKRRHL